MDTPRPEFGQVVRDRARSLREPAFLTFERARTARTCCDRPASPDTSGYAADPGLRVGIAGQGAGYVLVEVAGVVDISARPELTDVLGRAVDSGQPAVIVDLSAVTLLAAAGFGSLRGAADLLADREGQLHVVCPAGSPASRVLQLLDPDGGWPRHPDVPAAVAAVAAVAGRA